MHAPKPYSETMKHLAAAGKVDPTRGSTSAQCIHPDLQSFNQRPGTPEEMRNYRKSFQRAAGRRFISPGLVEQKLPPKHFRYGVKVSEGDRASDCMEQVPTTALQDFYNQQQEAPYDSHIREPLGQSYSRGHVLPSATKDPNFAFGLSSNSSENSKQLIYFNDPLPDQRVAPDVPAMDTRFHREREVTRPLNRNYNWKAAGVDPVKQRFGMVERNADEDGVRNAMSHQPLDTNITSRRVSEIRNYSHDRLGQTRVLRGTLTQLGSDFVFGTANQPDEWGARKCINGGFSMAEQDPDRDLGVSIRALDAKQRTPFQSDHVYGTPSIRADLPAPRLRSVADSMNYGDEHNSKGLLYPSKFAYDGVAESEFLCDRDPVEIRELYLKMGMGFTDEKFERVCQQARQDFGGVLSANSFRHAYNKLTMNATTKTSLSRTAPSTATRARPIALAS